MPDLVLWAVLTVFAIDVVMLVGLIILKAVHRVRMRRDAERRTQYLTLLSRHLTYENAVDPIPSNAAEDEAFLDAVIDLRYTIAGSEIERLSEIATTYDLVSRQEGLLRKRFGGLRRLRAAVSLAELGNEASAPILKEHLDDSDDEIRVQSARGLARMGYTPAIDRIVGRLGEESDWVRARFGDALAEFGEDASAPLMAFVIVNHADGDTSAIVQAIRTLAAIGDYSVGPRIAQVLDLSSNPEVQIAAAGALGGVGGGFAIPSLIDALASSDWRVRAQAATSIGEVGLAENVDDLVASLRDRAWWVRRNSAAALVRLPGGVEALYRALSSVDPFARDAAAEALEDSGELAKAVTNHREQRATRDEARLLRHMRGSGVPGF